MPLGRGPSDPLLVGDARGVWPERHGAFAGRVSALDWRPDRARIGEAWRSRNTLKCVAPLVVDFHRNGIGEVNGQSGSQSVQGDLCA